MQIVRKVYGPLGTNTYYAWDEETKECVLVDAPDNADKIMAYLKENDLTLTAILLTHGHFDHIMAAEELREKLGVKIYALDKEEATLLDPNLNGDARFLRVGLQLKADVFFHDGDELSFVGRKWQVIATPGHTRGSCCFYLPEEKVLFSGDTLFQESIGRFDMPGGSFEDIAASVRNRLFLLPGETVVFPGHMEETTIGYEKRYNPLA